MTPALIAAFALMTVAPQAQGGGEPLPPGAPTDPYELSAWCYGALNEYLIIYDKVVPDLRAIDSEFGGDRVSESAPYASDMAAARAELKMIGDAVTDAEQASPRPIADRGVAAMQQGAGIWSVAETKSERELARSWLMWALPDRCDSNARELATRSLLLGKALSYNADQHAQPPAASAPRVAPTETALVAAPAQPAATADGGAPMPASARLPDAAPQPDAAIIAPTTPRAEEPSAAAALGSTPVTTPGPVPIATEPAPTATPVAQPAGDLADTTEPLQPDAAATSPGPASAAASATAAPLPPASPAATRPAPAEAASPSAAPPGADEPQEPML